MPSHSNFHCYTLLILLCVPFTHIFICVPVCLHPLRRPPFSRLTALALTLLLLNLSLFRSFEPVWRVWVFLILPCLGDILFVEEEQRGPFRTVFPVNLFRFMATGRHTPINAAINAINEAKLQVAREMVNALPGVLDS